MKIKHILVMLLLFTLLLSSGCGLFGNNEEEGPTVDGEPVIQDVDPTLTPGVIQEVEETPTATPPADEPDVEETPDADETPAVVPETGVPAVPPEVEEFADEWPMGNKDYRNTRAALNAAIDSSNVDSLEVAWYYEIPGLGAYGGAASTPLIANGIVYLQDMASNVFALDLESGDVIWEHREEQSVIGPNGVAIGYGKVFAQGGQNTVFALDMETGEKLWEYGLEGPTGSHQPYVYGGYVLTAAVAGAVDFGDPGNVQARRGYAAGNSGIIYALDQATGELAWSFQVIEDDFWGMPEINGGGGVWYPPAVDTETNMTYWATGNPAPFPGVVGFPNAASRPGPNLYTNSVLALRLETGEMLWYNQAKPADIFDLDFQISPIMATAEVNGAERDIVIGSGKVGRVLGIDRETGETLWDTYVGEHQNDELTEIPEGEEIIVLPGVWGGVETNMAYADGVVYVNLLNLATPYTADGFGAVDGTEAVANATGRTQLQDGTSELVAIDVNTGVILWQVDYPEPAFGAATVVNDLVFTSTFMGTLYAHNREDGSEVWRYETHGAINGWPAVAGDTIVWPVAAGQQPLLYGFRLGAVEAPLPPPAPTLPPVPDTP
jgi:outer membrane protein assembly factor BamB